MLDGIRTLDRRFQLAALDEQRTVVANKLRGLSREQSVAVVMPSGTTLLGLLRHLTLVEREWFQLIVAGRDVDIPYDEPEQAGGVDPWFVVADDDTPASILADYEEACDESRRIVDALDFADVSAGAHPYFGRCQVGWVVLHMIRETARHAGHADILREQTDGATGYM